MILNMVGGGGGAGLNFKVIGNPQPSVASENTIWVNTDTPITSWHFSAEEPGIDYLKFPYYSGGHLVTAGVTFTANADKSISVNGTAQGGRADYTIFRGTFEPGKYKLSGVPEMNGIDGISVWNDEAATGSAYLSASGTVEFEVTAAFRGNVTLLIYEGSSHSNTVVRPVLMYYGPGMVWIPTGTSSTVAFNALKKNGLMVYPLSAKQYVSGAWVTKEAKSYQGGQWVDWVLYLYNMGDQFVDITGGWTTRAWAETSSQSYAAPTVEMNDTNMVITQRRMSGRDSGHGATIPAFDIDLTNFNTIVLDIASLTTSGTGTRSWGVYLFAAERSAGGWGGTAVDGYFTTSVETKTNFSLTLDVSALSGLWCVGIGTSAYSTSQNAVTTVTVKSVRCYP